MTDLRNMEIDLSVPVTGAVKDPDTGNRCPMASGQLFATIMDRQEYNFLSLASIPKELMGAESPYTFQAVLVNREPAIPVTAEITLTGGCTVSLKPESFTREQEMNAGFQILAKAEVGPVEYALAENLKSHFFATWERTPGNEKGGEPNYYWGHYHEDRGKAIEDFCSRVSEKCAELESDRKPSIREQLAAKPPEREASGAKPRAKEAAR